MSQSLKQRTVNGVIWTTLGRFSNQAIGFTLGLFIARILTPSDYGTVALLTIFFAISNTFVDSGFSTALVRKIDRTERDRSTVFYFNVAVALFFYVVLFFAAPYIAEFYEVPVLTKITRISGLTLVIGAFGGVQRAQLTYRLDFKSLAIVSFCNTVVSGVTGLTLAYKGFGVWALVYAGIASSVVGTILLCLIARWRPTERFSKESFKELFGFGSKLLASGLLDTTYTNMYSLVIGKVFSPATLGNFARAEQYAQFPSSNITGVLQSVTFPVLCEIQNDDERLRTNYRKLLKFSAFIVFPLMVGLSALAYPAIITILTEKWEGAVQYLQIICFAMMWYPIHAINLNLLQVKGRSDLFLRLEIIKKILGVTVLVVTIPMGLLAMCYGRIVTSILCLIINTHYTGKLIGVGSLTQMKDLLPTLVRSMLMWGLVIFVVSFVESNALKLVVGTAVGGLFYLATSFRSEEFREVLGLIKSKRR